MSNHPTYYRPYESGDELISDEEDSASEFSDESVSDTEDIRIRREQDPRYAIYRAAGPPLTTAKDKNAYQTQLDGTDRLLAGPYDTGTDITTFENHVYLDPPKTTKTSLVSIKSINRDRNVYPTPYYFKIKLPRVYKNVTKFQMVQMSFPNNNTTNTSQVNLITSTIVQNLLYRGVPSSCISDCIGVLNCTTSANSMALIEQGRVNADGEPLLVTLPIDEGAYEDGALARELTFKANSTPPLNILPYDQFRDIFMATRDVSVLFNEPGEGFYSATTQQRLGAHHTKQDIMNTYYSQQHIDSLPLITERVAFNAYYFPVLKEMLATRRAQPFLQLPVGVTYEAASDRVLGFFEGLDSEFYYALGLANQGSLDAYRRHLTFELRNINRYQILHQPSESRFRVVHDRLHPSLQRDIGNRYQMILNQQLSLADLNAHTFDTIKTVQRTKSVIFRHLETNLSTVLGQYHFMENYRYNGDQMHGEYSAEQLNADAEFTSMFAYRSSFGGLYGTYEGTVMQFSTFADYHSTMYSYYHQIKSTSDQVSSVYGRVQEQHHLYVSTKYTGVLPNRMIETRSYSQNQGLPVSFVVADSVYIPGQSIGQLSASAAADSSSGGANIITYNASTCSQICCSTIRNLIKSWYSGLPTSFVIRTPQYRLGVLDIYPTTFNLISTVLNITSTGNLNYFMRINDEQGFNNMDIAMPENYMVTNDTTGQVKMMCAKILMGGVGDTGISQTVIQNPSLFENTLGKLDKVEVKIYYDDQDLTPAWLYQPYFLDLTEWNATFQIDEEIGYANRATGWGYKPTVPVPKNPNDTPYLFVTHRDNPNNS